MQYSAHISLAAAADFEWNKEEGKEKKNSFLCGRKNVG